MNLFLRSIYFMLPYEMRFREKIIGELLEMLKWSEVVMEPT
jgi:hypothetical protein